MSNRVLIVAAVAVVACAAAAWMTVRSLGGARGEIRSADSAAQINVGDIDPEDLPEGVRELANRPGARVVQGDASEMPSWITADDERNNREFRFASYKSPEEASAAFDEAYLSFETDAPQASGLPTPDGGWTRAIGAWRGFVQPLIAEDAESFSSVMTKLGVEPAEPAEGEEPELAGQGLFDRLTPWLAGASVDLEAAEIRKLDPSDPRSVPRLPKMPEGMEMPAGAVAMMETRSDTMDEDGNTRTDTAVIIPLSSFFPNTERLLRKNTPAIEVWTPAKLSGERGDDADYTLAAMMVRDASRNTWVPIALRVRLLTEAAEDRKPTRRAPQ